MTIDNRLSMPETKNWHTY